MSADNDFESTPSAPSNPSNTESFQVPYTDHANEIHFPPTDSRQGTSLGRFEQQAATHAEGQLAHGTPAVRQDGHGVEQSIMEPRTVGQAPKETPLYRDEPSQPSMLEQAQQMAGQAYEQAAQIPAKVMAAVGMGGTQNDEGGVSEPEAKPRDPRVDNLHQPAVEEFLRSHTTTKPGDSKAE